MKFLFAAALLLIVSIGKAQDFKPDLEKLIANSKLSKVKQDTLGQIPNAFGLNLLNPDSKTLKLAPGIHLLPQDGMPCIVPDTQGVAVIPNAAKREVTPPANRIPNAVPDKRKLPDPKFWSK